MVEDCVYAENPLALIVTKAIYYYSLLCYSIEHTKVADHLISTGPRSC